MAQIAPGLLVQLYQFIFNRIVDRLQTCTKNRQNTAGSALILGLIAHNKLFAGLAECYIHPRLVHVPHAIRQVAHAPVKADGCRVYIQHGQPGPGVLRKFFARKSSSFVPMPLSRADCVTNRWPISPVLWQTPTMPSGVSEVVCR